MKVTNAMVDRFLQWPLPYSVCADMIATKQGPGRIGTNLLTATEAQQMLEFVLGPPPAPVKSETPRTDAAFKATHIIGGNAGFPSTKTMVEFARQLERELSAGPTSAPERSISAIDENKLLRADILKAIAALSSVENLLVRAGYKQDSSTRNFLEMATANLREHLDPQWNDEKDFTDSLKNRDGL
jgi:chemotaxis protein histidine kinase CheA